MHIFVRRRDSYILYDLTSGLTIWFCVFLQEVGFSFSSKLLTSLCVFVLEFGDLSGTGFQFDPLGRPAMQILM